MLNRSLSLIEYINVLNWSHNTDNLNIQNYRIYHLVNGKWQLVDEVNAAIHQLLIRRVSKDNAYTYSIRAVNNEGREGLAAQIEIR